MGGAARCVNRGSRRHGGFELSALTPAAATCRVGSPKGGPVRDDFLNARRSLHCASFLVASSSASNFGNAAVFSFMSSISANELSAVEERNLRNK
jgi:hypothetical protein